MQKKELIAVDNMKYNLMVGGAIIAIPFIVVALIPWLWLRLLIVAVFIVLATIQVTYNYIRNSVTVYSDECCNQKIFGDKPLDCKIRRDGETETIDDLDFPNSRK